MRDNPKFEAPDRRAKLLFVGMLAALACASIAVYVSFSHGRRDISEQALVALGREIFFDHQLSSDGTVSCASCHRPDLAFTDGRALALGVRGQTGTRNTPSLLTSTGIGRTSFFWDGRRIDLQIAVLDPFTNPVEMGLNNQDELLKRVNASPIYKDRLRTAFGAGVTSIDRAQITKALIAYLRTIDILPTAYDRYSSGRDAKALNAQAARGMAIFLGKGQCSSCHSLENNTFTDHMFHRAGTGSESIAQDLPELTASVLERPIRDDELGSWIATHPTEAQLGRFNVTHRVSDIETFATPSLRHVSLTAPYMHDGSVPTLDAAIDREIYYRSLNTGYPMGLTTEERRYLRSFLESL